MSKGMNDTDRKNVYQGVPDFLYTSKHDSPSINVHGGNAQIIINPLDTTIVQQSIIDAELKPRFLSDSTVYMHMDGMKQASISQATDYGFIAMRTAHLSHALDIAPTVLLDREKELQTLVEICKNESGYYLFKAEAYSGKSSLLSWFFLHPPIDVWMTGFFIVGQIYSQSDSDAFAESLKEQLALYINTNGTALLVDTLTKTPFYELLSKVAEIAKANGKKLILVVDALDEDKSKIREKISILGSLPRWVIPNLVIIISSRPEPNIQEATYLGTGHPVKSCPVYDLKQLKLSEDFRTRAKEELRMLYEKSQKSIDVVSLLAVANGALTVSDLAELTNEIPIEISHIFDDSTARTFLGVTSEFTATTNRDYKAYRLAHADLQEQAIREFVGKNTARYTKMLEEWCESYRNQKWPLDTPLYLLTGYLGLLADNDHWDKLADLLIDLNYVGLVSRKSISCSQYFHFIKETISGLSKTKEIDFMRIGLLTETREMLALRDDNIPVELPILFSKLGHYSTALKMTETMSEADRLFSLSEIAVIMAKNGETIYAVSTAQKVIDLIPFEMYPYQRSSQHERDYTKYLSNCAEAFVVSGHGAKAEAFFNRLITTLNLDERYRHGKHEMMFCHSLREIVIATAKAGDIKAALREAELLSFDWQTKGFTLVYLGVLQALQGDFEGAIKTAEDAYLTNYYNDGRCNENNRCGNEHITLECAKILKIIEMLSQVNGTDGQINLKIDFSVDGKRIQLSFLDLLSESNIQDYWNQFIGKMYAEIADEFLSLGFHNKALDLIQIAHTFFQKHRTEYKYAQPEYTDIELVHIAKLEAYCSKYEQAMLSLQEIRNINQIIEAYTAIAREAYKNGCIDEAINALTQAKQKTEECQESSTIFEVILATALIEGSEIAIIMLPKSSEVKVCVKSLCKIAEERLRDNDINDAEARAREAFSKLWTSDYDFVSLDKYHMKKHIYNPIDISKGLFDIGEYELSLNIAALSGEAKWYAKLLMKIAHAVFYNNKDKSIKLFETALDVIKVYNIEIDVNKKEHPAWGDHAYEKDEPTIMDFVIMSRSLLWIDDKDSAKSILPSYSEFTKMLWQSTNLYAYEGLYIYFVLGAKEEIEKDLLAIDNPAQLNYSLAWLAVVEDEFNGIDFSNITYSFSRDADTHALSISYDDAHSDGLKLIMKKSDFGLEYDVDISVDFYKSLEGLSELHEKQSTIKLAQLITILATPYDGENHYGKQENWSVRMILLIRALHELGILNQHEEIISNFEEFIYSGRDSVRDKLVWMWTETLILIDRPVDEIIEKIKITYDKKYQGEHYNPDRPNIVRALVSVLKKHPNHAEAIKMMREACRGYIENTYSHDYEAFIEAEQNLSIDFGLKEAFLNALQEKPWYDVIDLFAYFDLQMLHQIAKLSFDRIEERKKEQTFSKDSIQLQLARRNVLLRESLRF